MAVVVGFVVAVHVFVGGLVLGDLDGLYDDEHGDPDELEGCPEGEGDGPRVAHCETAQGGREDVAFRDNVLRGRREKCQVRQDQPDVQNDSGC